jgi:cephalosporin-C deacetylase
VGRLGFSGLGIIGVLLASQDPDVAGFKPDLTRPPDFQEFWARQLQELRKDPLNVTMTETVDPAKPKPPNRVWEIRYPSADGTTQVWGWYSAPSEAGEARKVPAIVSIPAFGGRRGNAAPRYPEACGLVVGYRGDGDAPWPADWITRGLEKAENSVFRLHYLNMVNGIRFLQTRPEVDAQRLFLQGGSLGGAMAVVLAGLLKEEIAGVVANVPGMDYYFYRDGRPAESSFRQMEQFVERQPAAGRERILRILGYYAPINFAPDVTADVLFSCGGRDTLCFPKMVYAVYNHLSCPKEIRFYPEAGHGSGPGLSDDWPRVSRDWLARRVTKQRR